MRQNSWRTELRTKTEVEK